MNAMNQNGENFNKTMFLKTIITSVIVGYLMVWLGLTPTQGGYTQALTYLTGNSVFMLIIDQFVNGLFNLAGEIKEGIPPTARPQK